MSAINIKLGEIVHFDIVVQDPTTGARTNADSLPTWKVYEEDYDTPMLSDSFALRAGTTGNYRAMFLATSDNTSAYGWDGVSDYYGYGYGFEEGKFYNIIAEATVGGITGQYVVMTMHVPINTTAEDVLAGIIDGVIDLETAIKRILSVTVNNATTSGTDPSVFVFKDSAGSGTIVTQSVPASGSGRTSTF